ncbi:Sensor protein DivL [compost metagenome]
MSRKPEPSLKRVYILYAVLCSIVILGYAGAIWYVTAFDGRVAWFTFVFITVMLALGGSLVWTLKVKLQGVIQAVDDIVDAAINGQERITGYAETNVSSLENKMYRYVEITKSHQESIEGEKSKIKALISDISHQTKTPLSNIILYSQLLGEVSGLNQETMQYISQIKLQSEKLEWLIQSLVKMSRLEAGMITLQPDIISVVPTITKSVSQIYSEAERKGIEIRISCDAAVEARHDAKWTSEALFNILENAVKYSEIEGSIEIKAASSEMFTRIDIVDTGMGIEESEWNKIFRRFYRSKRVSEYEGVGIGLFLAREIVMMQGGHIKVSSQIGEGSVFSVFLPLR